MEDGVSNFGLLFPTFDEKISLPKNKVPPARQATPCGARYGQYLPGEIGHKKICPLTSFMLAALVIFYPLVLNPLQSIPWILENASPPHATPYVVKD